MTENRKVVKLKQKINNDKVFLTIFTPTYNRSELLRRLYEKLCLQSCKEFVWLIIDDGSTDKTRDVVEDFINEKKIKINYFYQANSGKQQAVNKAIELCDTECFSFCDSDDWYLNNTVLNFKEKYSIIKNDEKICGIVARRGDENGLFKEFQKITFDSKILKLSTLYTKYQFHAETCALFKLEALQKVKYPKIKDKFIPESYMFDKLSQKYSVLFINKAYSVTEYREDGYTLQSNSLYHRNPIGVFYALREAVYTDYGLLKNIKNGIALLCWCQVHQLKCDFWRLSDLYKIPFCYVGFWICQIIKKPTWIFSNS